MTFCLYQCMNSFYLFSLINTMTINHHDYLVPGILVLAASRQVWAGRPRVQAGPGRLRGGRGDLQGGQHRALAGAGAGRGNILKHGHQHYYQTWTWSKDRSTFGYGRHSGPADLSLVRTNRTGRFPQFKWGHRVTMITYGAVSQT